MSATYELVCHETKETLWVGQGSYASKKMEVFYYGEARAQRLSDFLVRTMGKPLVLMETQQVPDDYKELE